MHSGACLAKFSRQVRQAARADVRLCTLASRAGSWCIYGSSLGAAGLVAVVVRDALGRLLMGLVHG